MISIFFIPKIDPGINQVSDDAQVSIEAIQLQTNITDGAEFLDDNLRMKDQPFGETTEIENDFE